MSRNKGFTLIELLVVIAIIGILSAIVLASLSSARNKAIDSSIKADLANARAAAELYASNHSNSYSGVCTASDGLAPMVAAINAQTAGAAQCGADAASTWALGGKLTTASSYWCVDYTGSSTPRTTQIASSATGC